jgi:opacity protein-like surface antigen
MRNKILVLLTFLSLVALSGMAQEKDTTLILTGPKKGASSLSLNSISLSGGYFNPSMSFFNNIFLPGAHTTDRFNGSLVYGANMAFNLPLNLGARVGVWYWENKVSGKNGGAFNRLKISLTAISLGAFYTWHYEILGIKPYLGLDGSILSVQDQYNANEIILKKSGSDFVWTPFIGLKHEFKKRVVVGLEYGYNLGSYMQDVESGTSLENAKISVEGHKVQLSVGYRFK